MTQVNTLPRIIYSAFDVLQIYVIQAKEYSRKITIPLTRCLNVCLTATCKLVVKIHGYKIHKYIVDWKKTIRLRLFVWTDR